MTLEPLAPAIPGLTPAQAQAYTEAVQTDAEVRFRIDTLTLSHEPIASLEPLFVDGQINVLTETIERGLQIGFLDPAHALRLDGHTPVEGVGGLDRLLQIHSMVKTAGGEWLTAPAGTWRPSAVTRDGDTVTLEGQSKECLHTVGVPAFTLTKRTNTVAAIRSILYRGGERLFNFPSGHTNVLGRDVAVGGQLEERQPWLVADRLARSIGMRLSYDLLGYACLAPAGANPVWRVVETDDLAEGLWANALSPIRVTTDLARIRNRVVVRGRGRASKKAKGRPAKKSKGLVGTKVAEPGHPFSPQSLAQNGVPWVNTAEFDESDLRTQKEVDDYAKARLDELLAQEAEVSTTIVPVWHLQRSDLLQLVPANGDPFTFRLGDASIPLGPSADGMSVGFTRSVRSPSAGRLRNVA